MKIIKPGTIKNHIHVCEFCNCEFSFTNQDALSVDRIAMDDSGPLEPTSDFIDKMLDDFERRINQRFPKGIATFTIACPTCNEPLTAMKEL